MLPVASRKKVLPWQLQPSTQAIKRITTLVQHSKVLTQIQLELVEVVGTEIFFYKFSHEICLSMNPQPLNLGHILQENICWYFIIRIGSEAVLEIVHVEPQTHQPPDGLPRHTCAGPGLFQLTPGGKNTLEFQD